MAAIKFLRSKSDCILILSFAATCWGLLLGLIFAKL